MGIREYIKKKREEKKELQPVLPPDGGWGWVVCAAAFTIQFIVLGTMNNFGILYVYLFEDFGRKAFETCKVIIVTIDIIYVKQCLISYIAKHCTCCFVYIY